MRELWEMNFHRFIILWYKLYYFTQVCLVTFYSSTSSSYLTLNNNPFMRSITKHKTLTYSNTLAHSSHCRHLNWQICRKLKKWIRRNVISERHHQNVNESKMSAVEILRQEEKYTANYVQFRVIKMSF